jgi:hypothetical protein
MPNNTPDSAPDDVLDAILNRLVALAELMGGSARDTSEAKAAIRAAIQSALPMKQAEEMHTADHRDLINLKAVGYNAAISEIEASFKRKGLL